METIVDQLKNKIENSKRIVVIGHVSPDGDTIGSGLALTLGLEKKYRDKKIEFILQDDIPKNISFLKETKKIKKVEDAGLNYDLAIFVDSATRERVGTANEIVEDAFIVNIDHHISNPYYGDLNIVNSEISSTSELMYSIIEKLGIDIDLEMAEALYLGLINDTGNFTHSNVKPNTFKIAAKLMEIGVNNNKIVNEFFKSKSYQRIKILGKALNDMEFNKEKKLTYFYLPYNFLKEINGTKDDTEGVVEELLNYSESEVSLFLREEKDGKIKGSMRSKKDKDVNKIASIFGGGGHIKAAGFTSKLSAEKIIEKVIENL